MNDFFNNIIATENFSDSYKHIYAHNKENNKFYEVAFSKQNQIDISKNFCDIKLSSYLNYYITKNSFTTPKRNSSTLFSLDNIVIDIDSHNSIPEDTDFSIKKLLYFIENDYQGMIPEFNYVLSGRGIQIWINLVSASSKIVWVYNLICEYFCNLFDDIIKSNNIALEVDFSASCNAVGVVRMPNSYNTKRNGFVSKYVHQTDYKYSLIELQEEFIGDIFKIKSNTTNISCTSEERSSNDNEYFPLNYRRINFIENYVENYKGECIGNRNNLLLVYFNSLFKITSLENAIQKLENLNKKFTSPLKNVKYICKYIITKGYLKISTNKFFELINLSTQEKEEYKSLLSNRQQKRNEAKTKKEERNTLIVELFNSGMSKKQIAKEIGCHRNTVLNVLKRALNSTKEEQNDICNNNDNNDNISNVSVDDYELWASENDYETLKAENNEYELWISENDYIEQKNKRKRLLTKIKKKFHKYFFILKNAQKTPYYIFIKHIKHKSFKFSKILLL